MLKYKDLKVKKKLLGFIIPIIFILTGFITIVSSTMSRKALKENVINSFSSFADLKVSRIEDFYHRINSAVGSLQYNGTIHSYLSLDSVTIIDEKKLEVELTALLEIHEFEDISVWKPNNDVAFSLKKVNNFSEAFQMVERSSNESIEYGKIKADMDNFIIYITAPIVHNDQVIGKLLIKQNMKSIYSLIADVRGLGETGETLIGRKTRTGALFLNPLRHDQDAALVRKANSKEPTARPIIEAVNGQSGFGIQKDYRGEEVIAVWRYIPFFDWGFVVKMDVSESYQSIYALITKILIASLFITIIAIIVTLKTSDVIVKPILKLKDALSVIGQGNLLDKKMKKEGDDEVGEMVDQANNLVWYISNIINFANEIGKGNFEFKTELDMNQGELGKSLINMSKNLKSVAISEMNRNWATEGLAQFATVLRQNNDNLELLAKTIIIDLVKYLEANQGSIYIVNEDEHNPKMELISTYAYDREKYSKKKFVKGESLIGQCWQEGEKIMLTEVPENYMNITSGLGNANPSCILLMPLSVNDEIYGIIEIASFKVFEEHEIEFMEKLSSSIATTLSSVKVNIRTASLLEEAQEMSNELQSQEEELRQNAEEMQATQEEMQRAQKAIIRKENDLRTIIDNSEDTIFGIDTNYVITVVNSKLKKKYASFGIDLSVGNNILDVMTEDRREFWKNRYDRALAGEKFQTEEEVSPGVRAKVIHYPMYDDDQRVSGIVVVSREILMKEV